MPGSVDGSTASFTAEAPTDPTAGATGGSPGESDQAPAEPAAPHRATFADLGVDPRIVRALASAGITHPFPIQAMTLPVALSGHDIIGQAKTGTGKTLGFGIPLLQRVVGPGEEGVEQLESPGRPQALVIVPTRELAVQVAGDIEQAGKERSVRTLTVYGGRAYEPQIEALRRGVEIVVGTPGRLIDLSGQGYLSLAGARTLVLDEADEMLDLGFLPDVEKLVAQTPAGRQTMLFSATMPGAVVTLARRYMTHPTHVRAADPDDSGATVKAIAQFVYRAHALDKVEMLSRLLQSEGRGLTIIFTRTKRTAAKVAEELDERGFAAAAIHGDLGQGAREQALRAFRNGKVDVLVATDVAARGIDVEDVTHVVNYGCPEDEKTYLHRIGRTGRAGNAGTAVTFVDWDDLHRWTMIDKGLDLGIPDPLETYSTSAHFHADLKIAEGITGRLPRSARTRAGLDAEEIEDLGETGRGPKSVRHGRATKAAVTSVAAERPRRSRERRRTRGGQPVDAAAAAPEAGRVNAGVDAAPDADPSADAAPSRRRRRRGGRGRGPAATTAGQG